MDRPLDPKELVNRRTRRIQAAAGAVVALGVLAMAVTGWVRPSVRRGDLRLARVDRGPVQATITASGIVVPEYEMIVTSPVDTRVARILCRPGDTVVPGQAIVSLDTGEPEAELRKLDDQILLKENARDQARLQLETRLTELRGEAQVKKLQKQSAEYEVARNQKLLDMGVISRDAARAAETNRDRLQIEIDQCEASMTNARHDLDTQLRGLDLEISILRRDREEAERRLRRATAAADRAGVVTWVVPVEGQSVRRGEEVARVADLGSFRVEASLSDVHSARLRRGLPVLVRTGEVTRGGRLANIRPTVDNGVITVEVSLDRPADPGLRPSLRVDVDIVTDRKESALRLKRGSFLNVDGGDQVFVLRGGRAVRTPVVFGLSSFDSCEVVSGLEPGEDVIISDMSHHQQSREVQVR